MNKWLLFYSIQYSLFRFAYVHAISQKKPRPQPEIPESLVVQIKETIIVFKTGKFLLLGIIEMKLSHINRIAVNPANFPPQVTPMNFHSVNSRLSGDMCTSLDPLPGF